MKREEKKTSQRRSSTQKASKAAKPETERDAATQTGSIEAGGDVYVGSNVTQASGDVVMGDKAEGDIVHGDKISNVTVNRSAIQIGTLAVPTLPVIIAAVALTAGLLVVGVNLRPPSGPAQMPNGFNVAVAQFGREDANGKVMPSQEGQELSQTVFSVLQEQTRQFGDIAVRSQVHIWHDSLPDSEMGTDIGLIADEQAAAELAKRIRADVVIYGYIDHRNDFIPQFYVSTETKGEIDAYVAGNHALGSRPVQVEPGAPLIGAGTDLTPRARAIFYLTIGLTYDALGRPDDTLKVYREAETQLQGWIENGGEGQEVLHAFRGQAALFRSKQACTSEDAPFEQEAQQAFENARNSNGNYARAWVGLGSVHFAQAQCVQPLRALLGESDVLTRTFDEYQQALARAQQTPDTQGEILARFGVGIAYLLKGRAYADNGQFPQADDAWITATNTISATLEPFTATRQWRSLAQAYLALGNVLKQRAALWAQQGDRDKSIAVYNQALSAYDLCIEQGRGSYDKILLDRIIAAYCIPQREQVNQALSNFP